MAVLQRQLRDRLGRTSKVHPISVERHVVEARVVNLRRSRVLRTGVAPDLVP
jgi:hypothetical protein